MRKLLRWAVAAILLCPIPGLAQTVVLPGSGTSSGSSVPECTAYSLVYIDSAGNLACALAPVNGNVSTAGRGIFKVLDTITGASATSNFLNVTGTFPDTLTATTYGLYTGITSSLNGGLTQAAWQFELLPSYTGADATRGIQLINSVDATSAVLNGGNDGGSFAATGTTTGFNVGIVGGGRNSSALNVGVLGNAIQSTNSPALNIAVYGRATNATVNVGGYFTLDAVHTAPTLTSSALIANNAAAAANIFEARDNGAATSTTVASANISIIDGAQMRLGNQVLTSGTMTPTIVGEVRTVTHSYAWTNAMVTALGAALTGDIVVADLPAKTRVDEALLVIDTAAAGTTTLTVSCGDAIVGTPFTGYILASDAKAAANTVYGDLISGAETGASLFDATTKWFPNYVPSYTATTRISCHFIATGTNLDTVTTSTGRLILTTTLLP